MVEKEVDVYRLRQEQTRHPQGKRCGGKRIPVQYEEGKERPADVPGYKDLLGIEAQTVQPVIVQDVGPGTGRCQHHIDAGPAVGTLRGVLRPLIDRSRCIHILIRPGLLYNHSGILAHIIPHWIPAPAGEGLEGNHCHKVLCDVRGRGTFGPAHRGGADKELTVGTQSTYLVLADVGGIEAFLTHRQDLADDAKSFGHVVAYLGYRCRGVGVKAIVHQLAHLRKRVLRSEGVVRIHRQYNPGGAKRYYRCKLVPLGPVELLITAHNEGHRIGSNHLVEESLKTQSLYILIFYQYLTGYLGIVYGPLPFFPKIQRLLRDLHRTVEESLVGIYILFQVKNILILNHLHVRLEQTGHHPYAGGQIQIPQFFLAESGQIFFQSLQGPIVKESSFPFRGIALLEGIGYDRLGQYCPVSDHLLQPVSHRLLIEYQGSGVNPVQGPPGGGGGVHR